MKKSCLDPISIQNSRECEGGGGGVEVESHS